MDPVHVSQVFRIIVYVAFLGIALERRRPALANLAAASTVVIVTQFAGLVTLSALVAAVWFVPAFIFLAIRHLEYK